jgi:YYY domain-containing protein
MKSIKTCYPIGISLLLALVLLRADIINYFAWWLTLLVLGAVFFPVACVVFQRFQSKGYIFSKVIGIAGGGYITWMLSSLRILPFRPWAVYLVLVLCLGASLFLEKKTGACKKAFSKPGFMRSIVFEEALFMALLAFWSFVRGIKPEIIGLEKFMDFGFVNSALRGDFFPPIDMWYASESINYYYLGQYFTAYITRLSALDSAVTYNLMMATLFAVVFMESFSIGQALLELYTQNAPHSKVAKRGRLTAGLLSGSLVCLSGSLHTFVYAWLGVANHGPLGYYYFPDATRYIGFNPPVATDETIHEFPLYSFVVSDLHAHVLNTIFVLLVVAAAIAVGVGTMKRFRNCGEEAPELAAQRKPLFKDFIPELGYFLAIFLIGLFPATNFWDYPIYIVVSGGIYLYANLKAHDFSFKSLWVSAAQVIVTAVLAYVVVFPFHSSFDAISSEIKLVAQGSRFYQLVVLYGYQVAMFILLLIEAHFAYKNPAGAPDIDKKAKIKQDPNIQEPMMIASSSAQDGSPVTLFTFLEKVNPADAIASILFICAIGLVILPEYIYVKDIYESAPRANTMFKLCYQAFILFALGVGYAYPRLCMRHGEKAKHYLPMCAIASVLVFCAFIYPFYAIPGWYGELKLGNYKGLDGTQYLLTYEERLQEPGEDGIEPPLELSMVDDYPIAQYLKKVKGQPVICEANGEGYTSFGRISSITGLPDLFNWFWHEGLWRNSDFDSYNERIFDIENIYTSEDPAYVSDILRKYNVKYIVVGKLERSKYGSRIQEGLLLGLGEVVVESNGTYLIKV